METVCNPVVFKCPTVVNGADFSIDDLKTFVESLETIARIERMRKNRRYRRKGHPLSQSRITIAEMHKEAVILEDSEEETRSMSPPRISASVPNITECVDFSGDENYFSGGSNSPTRGSNESLLNVPPAPASTGTDSGTESESGPFNLRPRSTLMTHPKYRTTRARIIGMVLKKDYAESGAPEDDKQRRHRVLQGLIQQKSSTEETQDTDGTKRTRPPTAEMIFIDKALRVLTL